MVRYLPTTHTHTRAHTETDTDEDAVRHTDTLTYTRTPTHTHTDAHADTHPDAHRYQIKHGDNHTRLSTEEEQQNTQAPHSAHPPVRGDAFAGHAQGQLLVHVRPDGAQAFAL